MNIRAFDLIIIGRVVKPRLQPIMLRQVYVRILQQSEITDFGLLPLARRLDLPVLKGGFFIGESVEKTDEIQFAGFYKRLFYYPIRRNYGCEILF